MKVSWEWLRGWRGRESEWQDELDSHLAMSAERIQTGGLSEEDAHRAALRQFGNRLQTLEDVRAVYVRRWLDDFLQDTRLAVRSFRRSPTPVILSATLARRLFGDENPIGQQIGLDGDGRWCPIVGVAADTRNSGLTATEPEYYRLRMNNRAQPRAAVALFRTSLAPATLSRRIKEQVAQADPSLPVTIEAMDERVGRLREQPRFVATLIGLFAGFGVLLAAVGLYGVLSFLVTQQTQEIGIRMALGARPKDIALQIQAYAGLWTAVGVGAGTACSLALTQFVKGLLFGVTPEDPVSLIAAIAVLGLTAAVAAWIPSRRAARVDPMVALRYE